MIIRYLNDRWEHFFIKEDCSDQKQILTGVHQCSKLGPFFLSLYINYLDTSCGDSKVTMFADDTTLINSGLTSDFSTQKDFDAVLDWLAANKVTINAEMLELMFFGSGNTNPLKNK